MMRWIRPRGLSEARSLLHNLGVGLCGLHAMPGANGPALILDELVPFRNRRAAPTPLLQDAEHFVPRAERAERVAVRLAQLRDVLARHPGSTQADQVEPR